MATNSRFFNAAKADKTLTLTMYSAIGEDFFGGGITPQMVTEALDGNYSDITLRLNSPGGDAFAGVAIYNILRGCGKPVNVVVDGMAASAASLIAMAGDSITMNSGSVLMIHNAMGMTAGDSNDMLKMADTLTKVTDSIADIYVARTGTAKEDVLAMMDTETWMNAEEAVTNKFATAIGSGSAVKNSFDLSAFKNTPIELKAEVTPTCECACEGCIDGKCLDCSNVECVDPNCMDCQQKSISNHTALLRMQLELNRRK
jgi:ATP-dependent protease ClpP protease subunit